jgi:hypothetical protein
MICFIDRALAREHFELAKRHVAEGERRVDAQIALLARLEHGGHDATAARALLYQFEQTLSLQIETRDRVAQELEEGIGRRSDGAACAAEGRICGAPRRAL